MTCLKWSNTRTTPPTLSYLSLTDSPPDLIGRNDLHVCCTTCSSTCSFFGSWVLNCWWRVSIRDGKKGKAMDFSLRVSLGVYIDTSFPGARAANVRRIHSDSGFYPSSNDTEHITRGFNKMKWVFRIWPRFHLRHAWCSGQSEILLH